MVNCEYQTGNGSSLLSILWWIIRCSTKNNMSCRSGDILSLFTQIRHFKLRTNPIKIIKQLTLFRQLFEQSVEANCCVLWSLYIKLRLTYSASLNGSVSDNFKPSWYLLCCLDCPEWTPSPSNSFNTLQQAAILATVHPILSLVGRYTNEIEESGKFAYAIYCIIPQYFVDIK